MGTNAKTANTIERYFCNRCKQKTRHFVRAEHEKTDVDEIADVSFAQRLLIVECCGCEHAAFVKRTHLSELADGGIHPITDEARLIDPWDEEIYPPVTYRMPPSWFEDLPDSALRQISEEIYKSLQSESLYLATFGARTLLDRLVVLVEGDKGNFQKGLEALVGEGKLSRHEHDILGPVIEAGHAAAHRGWAPTKDQVKMILDTVEELIKRLLVLPQQAEDLKEAVPSRGGATDIVAGSQVDITQKIDAAPASVRGVFYEIEKQFMALGNDVSAHWQKHYVAFKRNRNFASVQIYNRMKQVRVYLNIDPDVVDVSRSGVRDVRQVGHYGTGDLELTIKTKKEIGEFFDLFELSYGNS